MTGLDLTVWPCHPPGSWQRALAYQVAGLPVEDADARALAAWDRRPVTGEASTAPGLASKYTMLRQQRGIQKAVASAIVGAIEPGEVVGSFELARRIAGKPGVPPIDQTTEILKAMRPSNGNAPSALSRRNGRVFKRYIDNLGGKPGHFFARKPSDLDRFTEQRRAYRRDIGERMRNNLQLGRPRKRASDNDNARQS